MSATAASALALMVAKVYFLARGTGVAGNCTDAGQRATDGDKSGDGRR